MATHVLKKLKTLAAIFSCLFLFQSANAQPPIANFTWIGTYNGHYYYISTGGGDFGNGLFKGNQIAGAVAPAKISNNAYAAAIFDMAENTAIQNFVIAYNIGKYGGDGLAYGGGWDNLQNPWIGFTDDPSATTTEGNFVWSNGQDCSNFTNWNIAEPNNFAPTENFTEMLIMRPYNHDGDPTTGPGGNEHNPLGKWNDWFNEVIPYNGNAETRLAIVLEIGDDCPTGNQGCTLGYWKNHEEDWPATGYSTGQTLESVWDVPNSLGMDNTTLMEALNFGGGPGVLGGARNLFKQAVAALLNAAHPDVDYPLTVAQVISQVNTALATGNRDAMLALAGTLDGYNNLHGNSLCGNTNARQPGENMAQVGLEKAFGISGYPNPSRGNFNIKIDGLSSEKVSIRVTDVTGRLVEQRTNLTANQVMTIGNTYRAGMYNIEVTQGTNRQQLKLVKQ